MPEKFSTNYATPFNLPWAKQFQTADSRSESAKTKRILLFFY